MKTKIPYIIALLVAGVLVSWQRGPATDPAPVRAVRGNYSSDLLQKSTKAVVHYQVNVFLVSDITPCGTYLVSVINSSGATVAPPQTWSPGKEKYFFTEVTRSGVGVRIAKLIRVQPSRSGDTCPFLMTATPDTKNLNLSDGAAYFFDLLASESANY